MSVQWKLTKTIIALAVSVLLPAQGQAEEASLRVTPLGASHYQTADLAAYTRLVTKIQFMIEPEVNPFDPGFVDPSPLERVREQFVNPLDPNLFEPYGPQDFPGIVMTSACELFAETWENPSAAECACAVYEDNAAIGHFRALGEATLAGNRVAAGGSCY